MYWYLAVSRVAPKTHRYLGCLKKCIIKVASPSCRERGYQIDFHVGADSDVGVSKIDGRPYIEGSSVDEDVGRGCTVKDSILFCT